MNTGSMMSEDALLANKITGANAGGPRRLAIQTRWAARLAQLWRSAIGPIYPSPSATKLQPRR
jgi:hypothetical protein